MIRILLSTRLGISIHALREEGDPPRSILRESSFRISIHALREEGDLISAGIDAYTAIFLSTPSVRRATQGFKAGNVELRNFYPRPP